MFSFLRKGSIGIAFVCGIFLLINLLIDIIPTNGDYGSLWIIIPCMGVLWGVCFYFYKKED